MMIGGFLRMGSKDFPKRFSVNYEPIKDVFTMQLVIVTYNTWIISNVSQDMISCSFVQ